ncbi:MAG: DUF4129 domain-containing protein [Bacteroidota bacterium]
MTRRLLRVLAVAVLAASASVAPRAQSADEAEGVEVETAPEQAEIPPPPPPPPPTIPPRWSKDPSVSPPLPPPIDLSDWRDVPMPADTLTPREAPADLLARYRADPDFAYDRPEAEGPSLWDQLLRWLNRTFFTPIARGVTSQGGLYVLIAVAIALLGWGVTRLLQADSGPLFTRRDVDRSTAGPLLDVEEISEVDLSSLLTEAVTTGDFREAVRYRYLLALQSLDARDAIRWERHKTNREYVLEARTAGGPDLATPFADTTRVFDWVWYGERPVDRARYDRLGPLFDRLDAALTTRTRPVAR